MEKRLYKIEVFLIKTTPIIYAFLSLLNTILSYFDINVTFLSYIGSVSLTTLLLLYVSSYVFKFCLYHRMFLHYTSATWDINLYDYYCIIPLNDLLYLCIQLIIIGILLFVALYFHVNSNKRTSIKDYR